MTAVAIGAFHPGTEPVVITEPGVYDGIPNDAYHADPVPGGSLSSSGAKKLLQPYCPAIYQHERSHPVFKEVFDFGSAAHKVVLGDEGAAVTVIDSDSYRTKAAQQQRDEARAAGLIPMLREAYDEVVAMATALQLHPVAAQLFRPGSGKPEQSMFWKDGETGVMRRSRLDWLPEPSGGRMIIPDYKTAVSADKKKFARQAMNFGYHQQQDWYQTGAEELGLADDIAFVFVVQEKTAPYLVNVIELDREALQIGRYLNRQALRVFAECRRSGHWPGYSSGVELVGLPPYYTRDFEELL